MSEIKLYEHNGTLIPVDEAKIVSGYKCKRTGQIFKSKKKFLAHIRKRRHSLHKSLQFKKINEKIEAFRKEATSFYQIMHWVQFNQEDMFHLGKPAMTMEDFYNFPEYDVLDPVKFNLSYLRVQYNPEISSMHRAPKNKPTNSSRDRNLPLSYRGFTGIAEFTVSNNISSVLHPKFSGCDMLSRPLLFNPGSGGTITVPNSLPQADDEIYGTTVSIFLDDWPGLDELLVIDKLDTGDNKRVYEYGISKYYK